MIYAAAYPEKFEGDKGAKLMQVDSSSQCLLFSEFGIYLIFLLCSMDLIACYFWIAVDGLLVLAC